MNMVISACRVWSLEEPSLLFFPNRPDGCYEAKQKDEADNARIPASRTGARLQQSIEQQEDDENSDRSENL